jgi:uncharacterized protein YkwD
MASKFSTATAIAAMLCLAVAPEAVGASIGLGKQRAVASPNRAADAPASASRLIAPEATCPDQDSLTSPAEEQEQAMICMTNFARANAGLPSLADSEQLDLSAQQKAGDVLDCDSFSHFACGREFTYWIRQVGYIGANCWHAGENLAWGVGEYGSVRSIFRAWMSSPTHRHNILGDYREVGIDLELGDLQGNRKARVWTSHFGSHCEVPAA